MYKNLIVFLMLSIATGSLHAAEVCFSSIKGIGIDAGLNGDSLELYIYSDELPFADGGQSYFHYRGNPGTVKALQAQMIFAKATGKHVCVKYTAGVAPEPSYRWKIEVLTVVDADRWPVQ